MKPCRCMEWKCDIYSEEDIKDECQNCSHDYASHLELGGCKGNNSNAPKTLRDLIM